MTQASEEQPVTGAHAERSSSLGVPVFVAGRQHSGNTVMTVIFQRVPACYSQIDENAFFEERGLIDKVTDPKRRADEVYRTLKLEAESAAGAVRAELADAIAREPTADALSLYLAGMNAAAAAQGREFWAQKATSYIFYGDEILSSIPGAKLIYMLRNPYDISASKKRRAAGREYLYGTMLGWNRGLRLAKQFEQRYPGRFMVVRYEDMTGNSESTMRRVFEFLGVPFDPSYLDVPHVNRSESGYSLTGDGKGLNRSRIYYYRENLKPHEVAALDILVGFGGVRDQLARFYPDLPHEVGRCTFAQRLRAFVMLAYSPFHYAWDYSTRLKRSPALLVTRTLRRMRGA